MNTINPIVTGDTARLQDDGPAAQQERTEDGVVYGKTVGKPFAQDAKFSLRDVEVFYGETQAIKGISLDIARNEVISFIGPSGCGKSTFLRCLNRMNDSIDICRVRGRLELDGMDIYDAKRDVVELRARGVTATDTTKGVPTPSIADSGWLVCSRSRPLPQTCTPDTVARPPAPIGPHRSHPHTCINRNTSRRAVPRA